MAASPFHKKQSSYGNLFFTSDTHFFHRKMIQCYPARIGKSVHYEINDPSMISDDLVQEMNERIIDAWNSVVGQDDLVFHLGDVGFFRKSSIEKDMKKTIGRLKGSKVLILGNHDNRFKDQLYNHFLMIETYDTIKLGKYPTILFHYPIESWDRKHYNSIHLHGHCHGSLKSTMKNRIDVGIDTREDLCPYSMEEIIHSRELKDSRSV